MQDLDHAPLDEISNQMSSFSGVKLPSLLVDIHICFEQEIRILGFLTSTKTHSKHFFFSGDCCIPNFV